MNGTTGIPTGEVRATAEYLAGLVGCKLVSDVETPRGDNASETAAPEYVDLLVKDRNRWMDHYNRLIGDALHVQHHLLRALGRPVDPSDEFDRARSRALVGELAAERDRLRMLLSASQGEDFTKGDAE